MTSMKLLAAGALALTLAGCHVDGHQFCDRDGDGETDVGCMVLVIGAKATAGAVAVHALHGNELPD